MLPRLCARIRTARDDERGVGIVMAIFVTLIVLTMSAGWAWTATHQLEISGFTKNREQAIMAAEAGVSAAVAMLSEDPTLGAAAPATIPLTTMNQGGDIYGKYEVTISTPTPAFPNVRLVRSTGYGPDETAAQQGVRTIEAGVTLQPMNEFTHALLASETSWTGANPLDADTSLAVTGDVFASDLVDWSSSSTINGNVSSWGGIYSGGGTVGGTYALSTAGDFTGCPGAGGTCSVLVEHGTVSGNVFVADDRATGATEGNVDVGSGGTVSGNVSTLGGTCTTTTSPSCLGTMTNIPTAVQSVPPPKYTLPTFSWSSYTAACSCVPTVWATTALWQASFQTLYATGFSGVHQVTVGSGSVELGGTNLIGVPISSWNMSGDLVIYTDRPVTLSASINNASGTQRKLVIISTYSGGDAVQFTGTVNIASTIDVLVYAPNERVYADSSPQSLTGSIYAKSIKLDAGFTVGHNATNFSVGSAYAAERAGFTWSSSSAFSPVQVGLVKEAPT